MDQDRRIGRIAYGANEPGFGCKSCRDDHRSYESGSFVLAMVGDTKQTMLQTAQFEERRIPWRADMLLQWSCEASEGQVRLDTSVYFDREVSSV